mgnify:CR=1 FL=1
MKIVKVIGKGLFLSIVFVGVAIMNFIGAMICAITNG